MSCTTYSDLTFHTSWTPLFHAMPSQTDPSGKIPGAELFPIRTVSSLTGVNAITLRAWERRYGLIRPVRTPTGHRLYRREDIDVIHRAVALIDKGISIGQVKRSLELSPADERMEKQSQWPRHQARMVSAISRFDEDELEDAYNDVLSLYPIEQVTQSLLLPLLRELGRRWETEEGSVAEEHFFAVYLRNKLGARFHHRARGNAGPRLLTACLPGEQHEIGLLLFALTAIDSGLRPVLLGANTPLSELAVAAKRARCQAVVLSGSMSPQRSVLREELPRLVAALDIPVFVGGAVSVREHDAIVSAGAKPVGSELSLGTDRIRDALTAVNPHS